jgi:eukaryotic-like serine/threonine-protein kinase
MKRFVAALGAELSLTSEEIADIIWLAVQMGELPQPATSDSSQSLDTGKPRSPQQIDPPMPKDPIDLPNSESSPPPAEIHPVDRSNLGRGLAISVPDARSLREPLELARSLKPLLQRVASGWSNVLDEEATILKLDRDRVWLPVLKPNLEALLDLVLVVDESVSMQIWQRTISELQRFLAHYGVFRDVRVYGLVVENERAYVRPRLGAASQGQSLRNPQELIDPSGRRLILVATDCVSGFWRTGEVLPALKLWAKSGPMAIVQMLPEWLWGRSGLGLASAVRFAALQAGIPNHQLKATNLSLWDDVDLDLGIKVPVVTLEPAPIKTWAQLVAGKGGIQSPGFVFDPEPLPTAGEEQSRTEGLFAGAGSGAERVRRFQVTASPMARQLAMILAAAPTISLPIVRILQDRLLPRSKQIHVAEVFLGGLLKPLLAVDPQSNPDLVPYEFMDGARDVLLDSVPTTEVVNVMQEVSQFVAERLGLTLDAFMGVLRNPQETEDLEVVSQSRPFALVTAQILRKLGGGYAQLAQELEQVNRQDSSVKIGGTETDEQIASSPVKQVQVSQQVSQVESDSIVEKYELPKPKYPTRDEFYGRILANRYQILGIAGKGVYQANDTLLGGLTVAVKFLSKAKVTQRIRDRFIREATISALLSQKSIHIVKVLDYGVDEEEIPFYVMEYLKGDTLKDVMQNKPMPLSKFLSFMRQICLGLQCAHEGIKFDVNITPVVHRDVKPSNFMIVKDPTLGELVKIIGFGIAFLNSDDLHTGFMGTPAYCSPEQINGETLDNRSDIYSLGIMMFQMLTGELPLKPRTSSFEGWFRCHHDQKPKLFSEVKAKLSLPQELMDVVNQCMAKKAEERPQTVTKLLETLEPIEWAHIVLSSPVKLGAVEQLTPLTADDICRQSTWPRDKPRAEIVFPKLIQHEGNELVTLWIMLSRSDIEKYQNNQPHSQFLFVASPHPMLLWLTTLYKDEQQHRMLPCYLDLKKTIGEETLQNLTNSRNYRLLLFALEGNERCVAVINGKIPVGKNQLLHEWLIESKNTPAVPGQIKESKRSLKEELEILKPKLVASLQKQISMKSRLVDSE